MTLDDAKQLVVGDKMLHNGVWANRVSKARTYEVLSVDNAYMRVRDDRGYTSRYSLGGCAIFVTEDFFASCTKQESSQ